MRPSAETGSLPRATLQRTASERGLLRTATGGPGRPSPMTARARSCAEPDRRSRRRSLWGGRTTNSDVDDGATSSCLPSLRQQRPPPPDFDGVPPEPDAGLPAPPRLRLNRLRGVHELEESLVQRQFAQLCAERNAVAAERGRSATRSGVRPCQLDGTVRLPEREVMPLMPLAPRNANIVGAAAEKKAVGLAAGSSRRRRMSQRIRHVFVRTNGAGNAENIPPALGEPGGRARYSLRAARRRNEAAGKAALADQRREAAAIEAARRRKRAPAGAARAQDAPTPLQSSLANAARPPTGPVRHHSGMRASSSASLPVARTRSDGGAPERAPLPRARSACASAVSSEAALELGDLSAATVGSCGGAGCGPDAPRGTEWPSASSAAPPAPRADRDCERLACRDSRKPFASVMNVDELVRATRTPAPAPPARGFEPLHPAWGAAGRTKSLRAFASKARGRVKSALGPLPPTHTPVVKGRWGRRNVSAAGN